MADELEPQITRTVAVSTERTVSVSETTTLPDIDWFRDWRVILNLALWALFYGALGSFLVWVASPESTRFLSKPVLAAGLVPAIGAFQQRLATTPRRMAAQNAARDAGGG